MSGSASKIKGKSGEREFCQKLGKIFGGTFIRVPNSGAFVGGKNAARKEILHEGQIKLAKGDIIPPDFLPKFVAECKFYKDFPFHLLVRQECKQLDTWIEQTLDCTDPSDIWFVLIKINRRGHFVCFDNQLKEEFTLKNYINYKDFIFTDFETFFEYNHRKVLELCN